MTVIVHVGGQHCESLTVTLISVYVCTRTRRAINEAAEASSFSDLRGREKPL